MEFLQGFFTVYFAAIILMCWSVLIKSNPFSKAMSNLSLGLMLAWWLKGCVDSLIKDVFIPATQGNLARIAVLVLGLFMFLRFSKGLAFTAKWPLAVLAGVGTAIATKGAIPSMILSQIRVGSFVSSNILENANQIIIWLGCFSTLIYFIFSIRRGRVLGSISRVGQVFMMLSFGTVFGSLLTGDNVMASLAFMFGDPGRYVALVGTAIFIAYVVYDFRKRTVPVQKTAA